MPRPLRLLPVVLGLAVAVCGVASLTGGWLGVPSHQPHVASYGRGSSEVAGDKGMPCKSARRLGWPLLWYERTEERFVDFDAYVTRGRAAAIPALYVTTKIGPRSGWGWISDAVIAIGVGLASFGAWLRRETARGSTSREPA